jgi:drug/metabolite transporter (DMT)-like permease
LIVAALGTTWLVGGSMFIAIRWALTNFPALYQMGTQFIVGAILLGVTVFARGEPLPDGRQWLGIALGLLGVFLLSLGNGFSGSL